MTMFSSRATNRAILPVLWRYPVRSIEINHDIQALGNVTLRLSHRLMGRAPWTNP